MPDRSGDNDVAQVGTRERRGQFFIGANAGPQGESLGLVVEEKQDDILSASIAKALLPAEPKI
jgi:hypothetical protein